jgi:hypothetical protein
LKVSVVPTGLESYSRFIPSNKLLGYCQSLLSELEKLHITEPENLRIALLPIDYLSKIQPSEIVEDRRVEEQAIEPVKQAAVSGKNLRRIFRARATL